MVHLFKPMVCTIGSLACQKEFKMMNLAGLHSQRCRIEIREILCMQDKVQSFISILAKGEKV